MVYWARKFGGPVENVSVQPLVQKLDRFCVHTGGQWVHGDLGMWACSWPGGGAFGVCGDLGSPTGELTELLASIPHHRGIGLRKPMGSWAQGPWIDYSKGMCGKENC